ncbi:PAS domain S-box protein [Aneurinibacillus sp. Ricciae_BoGa-3]|uniref:PAS domain S-box protein n=1 Tax=Aneurinibacillus sp. Ricciae_BoGa-3 TaxID=3022697 RepID=UPI002341622B|nr:PAS domain S-box protein [Aneurinibacillus sp. Ricciae_BoGa-3]WCK55108.1 PAS domain S-box protein [Aneurinibacillus sp. Ricciae_BoGa-3]
MENTEDEACQQLVKSEKMYREIVESSEETIVIHADHKVLYINQSGANFLRAAREDIIGACVLDIFQEDSKAMIKERIRKNMVENQPGELIEQTIVRLDGTPVHVELNCHPFMFGDTRAIQSVFRDITKRKDTETTLKKALEEINQLSAPLVPIHEGIAVLPLVGSINLKRAKYLLEQVPLKIKEKNIECLISDFSGIYTLDTTTIDYLFKISAILGLLGVRSVVTGVSPEIAQMVVRLGMDLSLIQTFGTVQQALDEPGSNPADSIRR